MSKPNAINQSQSDLFRSRLSNQLNPKHPLYRLAHEIDWSVFEQAFGSFYAGEKGQPPKPIRLMVGLLMLQHMEALSDERVVELWVENPYWQYFCGYDFLQWKFPIHPSSLTRWRHRLKQEGMDLILAATVRTSLTLGHTQEKDLQTVIADTTVMEKAIAYPVDSRLLNRAREQLVSLAQKNGIVLRQTYKRVGKAALHQAARYGHAKQYKRMAKQVRKLKTYLGRVMRDVERKGNHLLETHEPLKALLEKAKRLLTQEKTSSNKLYALHAPEVECIAKGKAHKRYEFGAKVSLLVTHKQGLAVSSQAMHDNPYDGHTLQKTIEHGQKIAKTRFKRIFADRGYRGHDAVGDVEVVLAHQKKLTPSLKKALKRRNAIEPHIGHMKNDGRLGRNWLKGTLGDQMHATLCAVGHNLRLLKAYLRLLLLQILERILQLKSLFLPLNPIRTA